MEKELISLRADDLPLLFTLMQKYGVGKSINRYVEVHGNWVGALPGEVLELWLCYILSNGDHRLSSVEKWAEQHLELLQVLSGITTLSSYDFSDDKLGLLLDYFSTENTWGAIETDINSSLLGVYRFEEGNSLKTFRLDAAPMQSYGSVKENGLLQHGYHKQHADLPQFKLKLCTLDNAVNHFAYPICHLVVDGKQADDGLYIPIMAESKKVLSGLKCYKSGNLFVGDSKFGSIGNRGYVVQNEDYYLMPLSLIQLSKTEREELIKESIVGEYKQVLKKKQEEEILIAEGFEVKQALESIIDETSYKWEERRLFVRSVNYAKSQKAALDRRLNKAHRSLLDLGDSKQGKRVPKTRIDYLGRIANILKTNRVEGLIGFDIKENQTTKIIRAYGKYPEREVTESDFSLDCWLKEEEIEERKLYLGWQVYATNTSIDLLSFEQCVWKYRQQSNIESRFDDLRNKMAPLLPVFLQKDNRIEGLVNILLLALKICSTMEYVIAKALQEQNEKLCGVYEGNPKRGTVRPSAKRLLKAFEGISISLIFIDKQFQFALMTKLETVQLKILKLLGIKTEIYTDLPSKIEMFFSKNKITET